MPRTIQDVEEAIDIGRALVALVDPERLCRTSRVGEGRRPVQLIVDGSDSNTATLASGYAEVIVAGLFPGDRPPENFRGPARARPSATAGDLRPRVWYNADLQSRNYIIPGLIAVIMMVIAALLTSLTVAREWESGTMEQLISTPVKGRELILGKLMPYFAIGMFDVLLAVVLMGEFLFQVPMRGSLALLFGMAAIFLVGTLSLGMLISIVTRNQLLASQLAMVHLCAGLPAFGVRLSYPEHAHGTPIDHLPGPGQIFRNPAKGDLPEGGRPSGFVCGGDLFERVWPCHVCPGEQKIQKKADLSRRMVRMNPKLTS